MTSSDPALSQLVSSDSLLREFFRASRSRPQSELAVELLREAITARMQCAPQKHYNVAYIKHNRFLSPSRAQPIADKITQIIPVPQHPTTIYAKPKPKQIDHDHNSEKEIETREQILSRQLLPDPKTATSNLKPPNAAKPPEQERQEDSEKYLSPKSKHHEHKHNAKPKQYASPQNKPAHSYYSPPAAHPTLNIQSNCRSTLKPSTHLIASPNPPKEHYAKVESRIKFLIDRDKQSRRMERALEAQNHKIERLEERQERLLLLQYEQERELLRAQQPHPRPSSPSPPSSQSSSPRGLETISRKLEAIGERAEGVRSYQHALYANIERLRDKTYKISASPLYPLSDDEEEEDY